MGRDSKAPVSGDEQDEKPLPYPDEPWREVRGLPGGPGLGD